MYRSRYPQWTSSSKFQTLLSFFRPYVFSFSKLKYLTHLESRPGGNYFAGVTSSWFVTLSAPTTAAAFASILVFSSSLRTGPFSVTLPLWEIILTLCAYVESDLSFIIALRICLVLLRSVGFIF